MSDLVIRTNNVPRDIIEAWELSADERAEFDYIDWSAVNDGSPSPTFFRYRGGLYDLGEFETTSQLPHSSPLTAWDGFKSDSFFSAVVVRFVNDFERVIVGLALS